MSLPAGIKIFGENWINKYCSLSASSGAATLANLYDQKQSTQFSSSGSDDTIVETVTIIFKNRSGNEAARQFNRLVVLNHNVLEMSADSWNGSAWVAIDEATLTGLDTAHTLVEMAAARSHSRVRFNLIKTQDPNLNKKVGELKVCLAAANLTDVLSNFDRQDDQRAGDFRARDGQLVAWKDYTKVAGTIRLENVSKTQRDLLVPMMQTAQLITVLFYSDYDMTETYEFYVRSAPNPVIDRKTQLYRMSLVVLER